MNSVRTEKKIFVNGILVAQVQPSVKFRLPVHEYLCDGNNRFSVESVTAANCLNLSSVNEESVELKLELHKFRPTGWVKPEILSVVKSSGINQSLSIDGRLKWIELNYVMPILFPQWNFLKLSSEFISDLGTRTLIEYRLNQFLLEILSQLSTGDLASLIRTYKVVIQENSIAYGLSKAEMEKRMRSRWEEIMSKTSSFDLFDDLGPPHWFGQCGDTIYTPLGPDGQPWLRFEINESEKFYWPIHLAILGESVVTVR